MPAGSSYQLTGSEPVLQFVSGFIVALAFSVPIVMLYRKRASGIGRQHSINQQQLEELSRLTGGLAHEIKNPLSTIKVNLKLITEEIPSADVESARWVKKIAVVQKETDRLAQILDEFRRYTDKSELSAAPADINDLISEMVDFYWPQAQAHNITIHTGLSKQAIICNIDKDMVKQVILNLFINAANAMCDGGELIVRTDMRDGKATIEISDTGCGIEAEKLDKIFHAYYSTMPGGSGLGLPTAAKIIEAHNGTIAVNSEPGKGTSFTITLPSEAG